MTLGTGSTPSTMTAPPAVRQAVIALWVLVGVAIVRTVYTIVERNTLLDAYVAANADRLDFLPRDAIAQFAPAYVGGTIVTALVFGVIVGLCAVFMLRGKQWARIVATVFCALTAAGAVAVLWQPSTAIYKTLGAVNGLIAIVALIMLFLPAVNQFFRAVRQARLG